MGWVKRLALRVWDCLDVNNFMGDYFDSWDNSRAFELWWKFAHTFLPWHWYHIIHIGVPPGYYDTDEIILHACFSQMLRHMESEGDMWDNYDPADPHGDGSEVYEEELPLLNTCWANWLEMCALRDWYLSREKRFEAIWSITEHLEKERNSSFENLLSGKADPISPEYRDALDAMNKAEDDFYAEEDDMLIRLMKLRRSMWT